MLRVGYKVVRTGRGTFWSAMMVLVGATKYIPHRWTEPLANFGPLTLFQDRDSALSWLQEAAIKDNKGFQLRRCLFIPTRVIIVWAADGSWELKENLPPGTILAKKVMVI